MFTFKIKLATQKGLEPSTSGVTGQHSNQLSYWAELWWKQQGSNLWPSACKADALPAELRSLAFLVVSVKSNLSELWQARLAKTQMGCFYPSVSAGWRFAEPAYTLTDITCSHYERPQRDSNPRPPPWQGGALTNWAMRPLLKVIIILSKLHTVYHPLRYLSTPFHSYLG